MTYYDSPLERRARRRARLFYLVAFLLLLPLIVVTVRALS